MQASYRPFRLSCNASNAYKPATALHRAFVSTLNRNHGLETTIRDSPRRQGYARSRRQQITALSKTACRRQQFSYVQEIPLNTRGIVKDSPEDNATIENPSPSHGTNDGSAEIITPPGQSKLLPRIPGITPAEGKARRPKSTYLQHESTWQEHMKKVSVIVTRLSKELKSAEKPGVVEYYQKKLEYSGRVIPVPESPLKEGMPIPWALPPREKLGKTGEQLLEDEVARFVQHMTPTPAERAARESIVSELMAIMAKHVASDVEVETHGSERTGLALATSDIDIRLSSNIDDFGEQKAYWNATLRKVAESLKESGEYKLVVYRTGKYPIINAQHNKTGIDVQIVCTARFEEQERLMRQYMAELPHLRSLYLLLRTALGARGLIDVFGGGIGSYGLFMMLVAGIKRRSSNPPVTLTEQLFRFVDFYSNLDFYKYGVSISPPKLFRKRLVTSPSIDVFVEAARRRGDPVRAAQWDFSQRTTSATRVYQPYLLCLQDPADPENFLGVRTHAIKHIVATLKPARNVIATHIQQVDVALGLKRPWKGESILLRLIGRCHEVDFERRARVERYGAEILEARESAVEVVDAAPGLDGLLTQARA